jgi:hypothetical protein
MGNSSKNKKKPQKAVRKIEQELKLKNRGFENEKQNYTGKYEPQ